MFAEGTVDVFAGTWRCVEHDQTLKAGRECPWCMHDSLTEGDFEKWMNSQTL
jgi:hypothetical protein